MSKEHQIEIEELLSALIDDEATERQRNEFDRLAKHDPSIVDQFDALKRQKQLLAALPRESAPDSLADDVSSVLQRRLILGQTEKAAAVTSGNRHLLMRRLLTTAAMLLLPLGLLSFVVYEIMRPASPGPINYVPTDEILVQKDTSGEIIISDMDEMPFEGILTFTTNQQMTVSNYIEKMIFDQGLMSFTLPNRTIDIATYQITAIPEKITKLINSLDTVWGQSRQITLDVVDQSGNRILIPNVQADQVKILAAEDSSDMLIHLAGQYAESNQQANSAYAKADSLDADQLAADDFPPLTMPILTGRSSLSQEPPAAPVGPTVRLRIHVKRAVE